LSDGGDFRVFFSVWSWLRIDVIDDEPSHRCLRGVDSKTKLFLDGLRDARNTHPDVGIAGHFQVNVEFIGQARFVDKNSGTAPDLEALATAGRQIIESAGKK
jgi:hypothetical protein